MNKKKVNLYQDNTQPLLMIKFFRLSKFNFAWQNQRSSRPLVEIAACGRNLTNLRIDV